MVISNIYIHSTSNLDKQEIVQMIKHLSVARENTSPTKKKQPKINLTSTATKTKATNNGTGNEGSAITKPSSSSPSPTKNNQIVQTKIALENVDHKDNSFREFRRLCAMVSEESSYNSKTDIMHKWFSKGSNDLNFQGNVHLWVRLMLPGVIKRVYNLQSKQLVKIFSRILQADDGAMLEDLEKGNYDNQQATNAWIKPFLHFS